MSKQKRFDEYAKYEYKSEFTNYVAKVCNTAKSSFETEIIDDNFIVQNSNMDNVFIMISIYSPDKEKISVDYKMIKKDMDVMGVRFAVCVTNSEFRGFDEKKIFITERDENSRYIIHILNHSGLHPKELLFYLDIIMSLTNTYTKEVDIPDDFDDIFIKAVVDGLLNVARNR